jgi:biotin carboxylase
MILGAGPLQTPAIHEARALGIYTIALDVDSKAIGLRVCDSPHVVDILKHNLVAKIARKEGIDGIMTLCTDAPVRTVAAVGQALSLPTLSNTAAAQATDKRLMRIAFREHGAPSPQSMKVKTQREALITAHELGYPLALKVGKGSGSRGVFRVETDGELRDGFASRRVIEPAGSLLLEEWIEGEEVSVEGYCTDREPHIVAITDKSVFAGRFPVESGHCQPSHHSPSTQAQITQAVILGIQALELSWCMFHAEVKLSPNGPRLIEIGARLGGDRIATHLTPLSTGVRMVRAAILLSLGERVESPHLFSRSSCIRYFNVRRTGELLSFQGLRSIYGLRGLEMIYPASEHDGELKKGFQIRQIHSSLDRYGHLICSGDDREQAIARCDGALQALRFEFTYFEIRNGLGEPALR